MNTHELPPTYDPGSEEAALFASWQAAGYFARDAGGFANTALAPYTIVIPPPNVTGVLHMGHALNNTLQDILIRTARMQGRPTRWIVGTDHAGIATQNKVEQKLAAQGLTRFDVGREAFVEACWEWRREYGSTIIEQLKAMGCSCDYEHEQFTMDAAYAKAIRRVFVEWYQNGLIYRGNRIINWCPRCTTALADDEVEHHDETGHLWHLRYPLTQPVAGQEYLVVATTRPETMLGDTGVAVNPSDERYQAILEAGVGVKLPLVDRTIPIFADDYVDASFGTGAVKVTPAHDPNDFDMGTRHNLPQINVFDEHAVVTAAGGRFAGLTREEAREAVVAALDELGLLAVVEEHEHAVGHCYRCDTTIEPWLSEQWFVAMKELAAPAIAAVRSGAVSFYPKRWENTYFHWMENIRDWCISRQLWWGHRIPVFYCPACGWQNALEDDIEACPECGAAVRQDEDVLDTWFSSQLWPFATQGWPSEDGWEAELAATYPTQTLSTARDIIFLWVARMVLSSLYFVDEVPFADVLIHPTVLDKHGNIMSKSRGNGIDPMQLISDFGADAMRFGLAIQVTGAQDMKFDADKLKVYRNFATKIWNASRFVLMSTQDVALGEGRVEPETHTQADRWILSRLAALAATLGEEEARYDFGHHARALYAFVWNELCDWYIEVAKGQLAAPELRNSTARNLIFVLDNALRLLHPYMPYITEKIWQALPHGCEYPSLMVAAWPCAAELAAYSNKAAERSMELLIAVVSCVRSTRARYGLSPRLELNVVVNASPVLAQELESMRGLITRLGTIGSFTPGEGAARPANASVTIAGELEIFIELEGLVDLAVERERLIKEQAKHAKELETLQKKLANEGFLAKAKAEIVEKTRFDAAEHRDALDRLVAQLASLGS